MVNKKLKKMIAALSVTVTGAIVPLSMSGVTTYAAEPATNQIMGLTQNQVQNSVVDKNAVNTIADSPVLKVINQTPKTPVDETEKEKQKTESNLPQSASNTSIGSHTEPKEQKPIYDNKEDINPARSIINSYADLQNNQTQEKTPSLSVNNADPAEQTSTETPLDTTKETPESPLQNVNALAAVPALLGAGTVGTVALGAGATAATLAGLGLLGTTAVILGALPATALLGLGTAATLTAAVPAAGTALLGVGAGTALAAATVATTGVAVLAAPVLGATALTVGVLGIGALNAAVTVGAVIASVPVALGATAVLGTLAAGTVGAALLAGTTIVTSIFTAITGATTSVLFAGHIIRRIIEFGILSAGAAVLGAGALALTVHLVATAVRTALLAGALMMTATLIGTTLTIAVMSIAALGILGGLALFSVAGVVGTLLVLRAIRHIAIFLAIGLAALTALNLTVGLAALIGMSALNLALLARAAVIGFLGLTALVKTATLITFGLIGAGLLGMTALALLTGNGILTGLGLLGITLLGMAGLSLLLGSLAVAGVLGLLAVGGLAILSLIALNVLGLGAFALAAVPAVVIGMLLTRLLATPLAVPVATLTWANIGRAWGRFIGALIGGGASFVIAGILGSIFSLPFLRPAFAVLWQLICVPLWSALGAFNGAVICTPIGTALGALLGLAVPVWSLAIGTWLVPMFALLWDSLATTQIVFTTAHLIAGLIGLPIGMLTWWNVGRAWGRFIGSWIGAAVSFVVAGLIGFTVGLPGLRIPFALLWQVICVPLWSVLGAFNGAVICSVLGTGIGAILGMTFPLWSAFIGSWLVPMFALLWDVLATTEITGAYLTSIFSQWLVRYPLRWARMNAFVFIPGALKSLLNIVLLRYGPLFNHIHKITAFSDSVDSGWGSLGYLLYGKTVVANKPVLDSAPWLVGYALGAWVNQYSMPGGRTNEIRFLLDPFYLPDYNLRNQMEELSNGSISYWKLLLMKFFARMSVRTSQVVTINIGSNDLWVPMMGALYDIANDGRLVDILTNPERTALFGKWPSMISNVVAFVLAWYMANALSSVNPTKTTFLTIKLVAGIIKEFTDYFINLPIILMHIFLLNPFATVVVEGTESPVRNWDLIPGLDDNLIEYAMEPVYMVQNLYKRLLVLLYPGKAVYADMHGIQLKTEKFAIPTFENLTLDNSGFDPHPSWIGRRQQADRILRALGQPSPYGWSESVYMRPSFLWNVLYPNRPSTFIHPLWARFRPLDGIHFRPLYSFQTILPSITGKLPINY